MKRLFLIIVLLLPTNILAQTDECNLSIETEPMPITVPASMGSTEIEVISDCPCEYEGLVTSDKWISFDYYPALQCPGTLMTGVHQHKDCVEYACNKLYRL